MRGPGEKELETDRRIVKDRISFLKEKLAKIDKQSQTRRKERDRLSAGGAGGLHQRGQVNADANDG